MMKFFLFISLILMHFFAISQKDLRKISLNNLPKNLQNFNNVSVAMRWTDSIGDNILIITKKVIEHVDNPRPYPYNERLRQTTDIKEKQPQRAFHYILVNDSAISTWEVIGLPRLCYEDISYTKNWFVVTDLNNDSIAEVWLIYKNECPENLNQMKIVMFENDIKYSAIGEFKDHPFLKSNFDQNFLNSDQLFQQYCIKLWKRFSIDQ